MSSNDESADGNDSNEGMEDDGFVALMAPTHRYTRPTHYRPGRRMGKFYKTVNERYIRNDLGFGVIFVAKEQSSRHGSVPTAEAITSPQVLLRRLVMSISAESSSTTALVIVDTNVLLHNLDVLEKLPNVVVPHTALQECRRRQRVLYDRITDMLLQAANTTRYCRIFLPDLYHVATTQLENTAVINDVNDARIRKCAELYGRALQGSNVAVVLLTDDKDSRERAAHESSQLYRAVSVASWAHQVDQADPSLTLTDLVARFGGAEPSADLREASTMYFAAHANAESLVQGVQKGTLHRGVFRSTSASDGMVTIRKGDDRVAVTLSGGANCNRAVDGDVVAIELKPLTEWRSTGQDLQGNTTAKSAAEIASDTMDPSEAQLSNVTDEYVISQDAKSLRPTGKVVGVLRRNFSKQIGSIYDVAMKRGHVVGESQQSDRESIARQHEREHADGSNTCVFFPVNTKIPPVLIRTTQRDRLLGQRIVISIDSWPATSPYPLGHYVSTIGPVGNKDVETEVVLQEYSIPHEPFSAAVLACLPSSDYVIDPAVPGRVDLRHVPILSIDPPNCKDIDDALHCAELPSGNWQVGVHIADVTHYVKPGTAIDVEAANRSTSTYLVNKRLDMLPGLLTTDLCSLKSHVDRYAFSVLWEVTPEAEIINVEFHKTVIHSIAALTYQEAQTMIDQPDDPSDIQAGAVKRLAALARKFRRRRIEAGALTLASPEVKFALDTESLNPTDVQAYALLEANAVVEEFMLLANVTVSKKILRHYPTLSVLRRHPAPNRAMFDGLISKAKSRGLTIDIDDSKRLADSLDAAQVPSDPYINKLLRILSTRCMSPAQYFCSGELRPPDWHHYGLAAPVYTHFTSPIRRYADVCVHRLLAAALNVAPLPSHLSSKSYLHDVCANMNRRHRAAQLAGRASVQLHTLIFFSNTGDNSGADANEEDAYVLDVSVNENNDAFIRVIVPRYGIEGKVNLPISNNKDVKYNVTEHRITVQRIGGKDFAIQVFDKVRVRIWVREAQDYQRELVLDLVNEASENKTKMLTRQAPDDAESPRKKRQKA